MKLTSCSIAFAFVAVAGLSAFAHSGATGIVKERMDMMKDLGATLKSLSAMSKTGAHDATVVRDAGQKITQHAAHLAKMFPAGSDNAPSEAAPAIWTDRARFDELFDRMARAGAQLAATADNASALPDQITAVAATCRDCHEDFRIKR